MIDQLPHHRAPKSARHSRRVPDCDHRGEVTRTEKCELCPKTKDTVDVQVYRCGIHGECVHRAATAKGLGIRGCTDCRDATSRVEPEPPPQEAEGFLLTHNGQPAGHLEGMFQGTSCFLICGGPSLNETPLELLSQRGILTAAVNNVAATHVRPHLWFSVDAAASFHESIWNDPAIMKFARRDRSAGFTRTLIDEKWVATSRQAATYPNVWFYKYAAAKEGLDAQTFLTRSPPLWAAHYTLPNGHKRETRSCLLPTLRILYWLGVRTLYIVGADFNMETEKPYAFDQLKSREACGTNNTTYGVLRHWFADLKPVFDAAGFHVFNATHGGRLEEFPRIEFEAAVERASLPPVETVRGMYG